MTEGIKNEDSGKLLLGWVIPEYVQYERSRRWCIWAGIVFALMLFYAVYTLDFLFVVILILGAVTIIMRSVSNPDKVDFGIFENGINIGRKFHAWKDVNKFYLIYEPPEIKSLYFEMKGLQSSLQIPLEKQNPLRVREALLKYLIEDVEREHEPISDSYSRFLKI